MRFERTPRKTLRTMMALTAAAGFLGVGISGVAMAAPAMAKRPMTFWYMGITNTQAQIVQRLLLPWARSHHTTVTVTPVSSGDFTTQVDTAIASGTLPNVMVTSQGYPDIYAVDHLAVNISAVDPSLAKYIKAHEPPLLAAGNTVYRGNVYGALESATPELTYVNIDALKKLGLPMPTSWQVLDHTIIPALLKHHLNYAGPGNSEWDWYAVLYSFGGQVYSPGGNKVVMASPAGQAALKAYLWPYVVDHVSTSTGPTQTMADLFANGKYPVQLQGSGFFSAVTAVPHFPLNKWEVLPYPAGSKGDYTWTGGTAVAAFNHGLSVNKEEASLLGYFWSAPVQRSITEQFAAKTQTLYTVANMLSWNNLKVKGLTAIDLKTMRTSVLHSVGVQSRTKVTLAQILGMGNTWMTIQNDFDKMTLPKATLKGNAALLVHAAGVLQTGINQAGSGG